MRFEGGFQGRCNKLVDGCYSFWQAGLLPLLHRALHAQGEPGVLAGLVAPLGCWPSRRPGRLVRGVETGSVHPGFWLPSVDPPALGTRVPARISSLGSEVTAASHRLWQVGEVGAWLRGDCHLSGVWSHRFRRRALCESGQTENPHCAHGHNSAKKAERTPGAKSHHARLAAWRLPLEMS